MARSFPCSILTTQSSHYHACRVWTVACLVPRSLLKPNWVFFTNNQSLCLGFKIRELHGETLSAHPHPIPSKTVAIRTPYPWRLPPSLQRLFPSPTPLDNDITIQYLFTHYHESTMCWISWQLLWPWSPLPRYYRLFRFPFPQKAAVYRGLPW